MGSYPVEVQGEGDEAQLRVIAGKGKKKVNDEGRHRLTIISTLGCSPRIQCWCGQSLILDYFLDNGGCAVMTKRLSAFLDAHERCEATA